MDRASLGRAAFNPVGDPSELVLDRARLNTLLQQKLVTIQAARLELKQRRDQIDGETLLTLTQELDLEEEQIRLAMNGAGEAPA